MPSKDDSTEWITRFKNVAALLGAAGIVWTAITPVVLFFGVDPLMAWADKRYDQRYIAVADFKTFEERFNQYELRQACQDTETKRDQIQRIINQLDPNTTPREVMKDYEDDLKKYTDRYDEWGCANILETIPVIVSS